MILKSADDRRDELARLQQQTKSPDAVVAKVAATALRMRAAGANNEDNAAYFIDFGYAKTRNWVVIHDLRLESHGRTAQIDHLLICRTYEFYVLESKHFRAGVKITETGEFMRWDDYRKTYRGMESPIEQNKRHIDVLRDALGDLPMPERLGIRLRPTFHSLILVSPGSRIDRPKSFDTSMVIKADQIRQHIEKDTKNIGAIESVLGLGKVISTKTLSEIGKLLVSQHRPDSWPLPPVRTTVDTNKHSPARLDQINPSPQHGAARPPHSPQPSVTPTLQANSPTCKRCGGTTGVVQYGRYGYYFRCTACDTNTAIHFTCKPGHHPRLRKAGTEFYRDCSECGSSQLYFVNR